MIKSKILCCLCIAALGLPFAEASKEMPNVNNSLERYGQGGIKRFPKKVGSKKSNVNEEKVNETKKQTYIKRAPVTLALVGSYPAKDFNSLSEVKIQGRNAIEPDAVKAAIYLENKEWVNCKSIAKILNVVYGVQKASFENSHGFMYQKVDGSYIWIRDIEDSMKDCNKKEWHDDFIQKLKNKVKHHFKDELYANDYDKYKNLINKNAELSKGEEEYCNLFEVLPLVDKIINKRGWDWYCEEFSDKFRVSELTFELASVVTYLWAMGASYDEIIETVEGLYKRTIGQSTISGCVKEDKDIKSKKSSRVCFFHNIDDYLKLSEEVEEKMKEYVRGYKITKKKAEELLSYIDEKDFNGGEYTETDQWKELVALDVLTEGMDYDSLKMKLNEFSEKGGEENASYHLTNKESETLKYLLSVNGEDLEIRKTVKNVLGRSISGDSVKRKRTKIKGETAPKKPFNEMVADVKLTDLEKNRILKYARGYRKNRLKLVVFLLKGGYSPKKIESKMKKLFNKEYCEQMLFAWKDLKKRPEEVAEIFKIDQNALAEELDELWTYCDFVDSKKDEEKEKEEKENCDFIKKLLKTYNVKVHKDNNVIYNTNYQRNMINNQINTQSKEEVNYIDNGQNNYINNNVIEFDNNNNNFNNDWNYGVEVNYNNPQMNVESNNNVNCHHTITNNQAFVQPQENNVYIDNGQNYPTNDYGIGMKLDQDDNNYIYNNNMYNGQNNYINNNVIEFDNNWNYGVEVNYNNPQMNVENNTNCQQDMANNQAFVQPQENNVYIDNGQNYPTNDYGIGMEFEQDGNNNNFSNNWNNGFEVNYNNPQMNVVNNTNYQQGVPTDQINTQSKEDGGYIDNENVETGDEYNSSEFEEETGFMQKEYY